MIHYKYALLTLQLTGVNPAGLHLIYKEIGLEPICTHTHMS